MGFGIDFLVDFLAEIHERPPCLLGTGGRSTASCSAGLWPQLSSWRSRRWEGESQRRLRPGRDMATMAVARDAADGKAGEMKEMRDGTGIT